MNIKKFVRLTWEGLLHPSRTIMVLDSLIRPGGKLTSIDSPWSNESKIFVLLPDELSVQLYLDDAYEVEVTEYLKQVLKPGDNFFDIGAHLGYHSLFCSTIVGTTGKIVSFEPTERTYFVLAQNARTYENILIDNRAISDGETSTITLYDFGRMFSSFNTSFRTRVSPLRYLFMRKNHHFRAPSTSIDQYVAESSLIPNVIKIDIEGGEVAALLGARETIENYQPVIIVEVTDTTGSKDDNGLERLKILDGYGYSFYEYDFVDAVIVIHKPRKSYEYCNILCLPKKSGLSIDSSLIA